MRSDCWDVFGTNQEPGSLWAAYNLARNLAQRKAKVRLFVEGLGELSINRPEIVRNGLAQSDCGVDVIDAVMTRHLPPSSRVVSVLHADIDSVFLQKAWNTFDSPIFLRVVAPWELPGNISRATEGKPPSQWARIAPLPEGYGYIATSEVRIKDCNNQRPNRGELLSKQIRIFALPSDRVIFSDIHGERLIRWLEVLQRERFQTCVVLPAGKAQSDLLSHYRISPASRAFTIAPNLRFVFLPQLRWHEEESIVIDCDLVLAASTEMLIRTLNMSVPLLPLVDVDVLDYSTDWVYPEGGEQLRAALIGAAYAIQREEFVAEAWQQLVNVLLPHSPNRKFSAPDTACRLSMADVLLARSKNVAWAEVPALFADTTPVDHNYAG